MLRVSVCLGTTDFRAAGVECAWILERARAIKVRTNLLAKVNFKLIITRRIFRRGL
jgi:hypothetical protein